MPGAWSGCIAGAVPPCLSCGLCPTSALLGFVGGLLELAPAVDLPPSWSGFPQACVDEKCGVGGPGVDERQRFFGQETVKSVRSAVGEAADVGEGGVITMKMIISTSSTSIMG